MSTTQEQSRALMMRHRHFVKHRQQSLLSRAAADIGLPAEASDHWTHIQGKPSSASRTLYDRSNAAMS